MSREDKMVMLNEALKEIMIGEGTDFRIDEHNFQDILQQFKGIVEFDDLFEHKKDNELDIYKQEQDEEESSEESIDSQSQIPQREQLYINEPHLSGEGKKEIHDQMQKNPFKRTFLKAIGQRESHQQIQNQYGTRSHRDATKQFNIYKFSDFRYAPSERVKKHYTKMINNFFRYRRSSQQKFPKQYFDGLLSGFKLLNDRQIQEYFNQNKQVTQIRQSFKDKKTRSELEESLSQYTQLQNECKDQYLIISQERKTKNLYNELLRNNDQVQYRNPHLESGDFFEELHKIGTRKRIKLESPYTVQITQNNKEEDSVSTLEQQSKHFDMQTEEQSGKYVDSENSNEDQQQDMAQVSDQKFVDEFFNQVLPDGTQVYERCEDCSISRRQDHQCSKEKMWGSFKSFDSFKLKENINSLDLHVQNFNITYTKEDPGKDLQSRIIKQIEAERKLNEQLKDNKHDPDELKKLSEETPPIKDKASESHVKQDKDFDTLISDYSYYNEHILDFCLGKDNNFLQQSYQQFNRIEVDLSDPMLFAEKLEVMQHLKRTQIITSQVKTTHVRDQVLISRAPEQSIRSYNPLFKNQSDLASRNPNDRLSNEMNSNENSEQEQQEEQFEIDYSQNMNTQQFQQPLTNDEKVLQDIQFIIDSHQKKKLPPAPIHNSVVAEQFLLNNFSQEIDCHNQYHRSDILDILFTEKERTLRLLRNKITHFDPWNIIILPKFISDDNDLQNENLLLEQYPEKLNSQDCYKSLKKLSLVKDDFILFEYLEQRPLIMNDTGMCIKAYRYLYDTRALNAFQRIKQDNVQELKLFKDMIVDKLGKFGQIQFLGKNEFLPTQGQITDEMTIGLTVLENDLFRAPVYKQRLPETDFLMVRRKDEQGNYQYVLRLIEYIFVVGQIEPKEEIYTPHSRSLGTFLKNCLKTYIKQRFRAKGSVSEDDLQEIFPKQSKQNRRNALKECNGEQDQVNPNIWNFSTLKVSDSNKVLKYDITAKQVCRYESMLHSSYLLHQFGLRELKNSDKMKKTLQVFLQRHPQDYRDWIIARRIEDELNMTSWSQSTSFLHSANQTGRMMLYGFGDPTGNMGGLSYVKKPLKARGEKDVKNKGQIEKKPTVMGTDADLRKLHVQDTREILLKLGKTADQVTNLKRWKMIDLIAKFTQSAQEDQESEQAALYRQKLETLTEQQKHQLNVIIKFAKNQRLTTKMQKDQYQKELNNMLNLLSYNMSIQFSSEFKQFKSYKKKKKIQDEKLKDLEYQTYEIDPFIIEDYENYMLKLDAFIKKEKKIWEDKKRKKGLE